MEFLEFEFADEGPVLSEPAGGGRVEGLSVSAALIAAVLLPLLAGFAKAGGKSEKPARGTAKSATTGGPKSLVALWNARDKEGNIDKLIAACEKAAEEDPEDFDAHWICARACWWAADRSADSAGKKEYGAKGYGHGERAVALEPDRVEGYTWYAAALGEYGLGISIVKALFQGLDGNFRKYCQQAIEIDPAHDGAAPLRALGRFYSKLPFPKQDLRRSRELLEEAVKIAPDRFLTRVYLAETLIAMGKSAEALPHLKWVLEKKAAPDERADQAHLIAVAKGLCKEVPGGNDLAGGK